MRDSRNETIIESAWCGPPFNEPENSWEALVIASTVLFFVLPNVLLLTLYLRIARTLQNSGRLRRCASAENGTCCQVEKTQVQSRQVVIRMLGNYIHPSKCDINRNSSWIFYYWVTFPAQRSIDTTSIDNIEKINYGRFDRLVANILNHYSSSSIVCHLHVILGWFD